MEYDLIVIGGGVAGLMAAAVAASQPGAARVLLLEKMEKPARKLRITGKGRCNLTNVRSREEFLGKVRQGAEFFAPAFDAFDNTQVVRLFEKLGVPLVTERGGRVFPQSGRAWDLAEALVGWAKQSGVEIRCHTPVESVWTEEEAVKGVILESGKRIGSQRVILATGGVSYPSTGSTGEGHRMAAESGHGIEPLRPALVPLEVDIPRGLKGLGLKNVNLTLLVDGRPETERFGEMEFTGDRVAGGAIVLQISRRAVDAVLDGSRVVLSIDLKPALSAEKLKNRILRETEALGKNDRVRSLLRKLLPGPLIPAIARAAGVPENAPIGDIQTEALIAALKGWQIPVTDYRPFTEAIVTAGGVELSGVDPLTMASRKVKGLYFAGELLDIDADTGGYNIQVALSTGYVAGKSAVKR